MAKKRKFNKSKEWLIEQYVIFDRPRKEIAAECGLSEAGLKSLLAEFKILKNKFTIDKKELENLVNQKLSVEKIAKQLNCSETSVYRYLKKYNLNILADPKIYKQYDSSNDEEIIKMYNSGKSSTDIARYFGITHNTVLTHLDHCGIKRRNYSESQWMYNQKEFPQDLRNKEFTNLNNLITYCKDCHFYKIHGYQRKEEKLQALQKSPELLETPEMDNQQPSIINTGSTTISNESTSKQMEVGDTLNSDDIV